MELYGKFDLSKRENRNRFIRYSPLEKYLILRPSESAACWRRRTNIRCVSRTVFPSISGLLMCPPRLSDTVRYVFPDDLHTHRSGQVQVVEDATAGTTIIE